MRKISFYAPLFILFFAIASPAYASQTSQVSQVSQPLIEAASFVPSAVVFNGRQLDLQNDPLVGIVRAGETSVRHYMPVKAVLEQMGYIVNFDDSRDKITVITPGDDAPPHVPSASSVSTFASGGIRAAAYNGYTLIINGTVMDLGGDKIITVLRGTEADPAYFMPVRPVLEYLGYYVGWDEVRRSVIVASDSYYGSFGVLKAEEPAEPEEQEAEGVPTGEEETVDENVNATEPLPSPGAQPDTVTVISLDKTVADAINTLMDNLHDPTSIQFHSIRFTGDEIAGYAVYIDFSSRNALGGYARRIAEIDPNGGLIVEGETQVEGAPDNTVFYTAIRMAFQNAMVYEEFTEV